MGIFLPSEESIHVNFVLTWRVVPCTLCDCIFFTNEAMVHLPPSENWASTIGSEVWYFCSPRHMEQK